MTTDEIADFCEFKNCRVSFGNPELGFIHMDGRGVTRKLNNYRRFLALNELAHLPPVAKVLESATVFIVDEGLVKRKLTREDFDSQLSLFREIVGAGGTGLTRLVTEAPQPDSSKTPSRSKDPSTDR